LDSLASALGYTWLRSKASGKVIAYITTPKEDFTLRAENLYALAPMPSQVSQFALADHNVLRTTYASPTANVVAVIDHHEDEGQYKDTANPRIVEPAGSCSSLVARLYQSFSNLSIPPELSTLLLSAILIDTHGLQMGGKALDVDREAAAFLIPQPLRRQKKLSVFHLSTRDLLRRDYKEYVFSMPVSEYATQSSNVIKVGLATVPLPLFALFASSSYPIEEIQDWLADRDLSADKGIAEKVWQGLESSEMLDLSKVAGSANAAEESEGEDVEEVTSGEARFGESYIARAYKQGNASATRKQTAPIFRRLVEGL
ncbi:hypothetical protein CY34DRAFT_811055, partial [Suillus luteus UH-Slu-Lm8-n1]